MYIVILYYIMYNHFWSTLYIKSTNIPPIMIINRVYETQNLLSLQLLSFLDGLRTYQHLCTVHEGEGLFLVWRNSPTRSQAASLSVFLDHTHTHTHTHTNTHTRQDSSERVISPLKRQLPAQHTTNIRDEKPCPQRDSNPPAQQSGGCRTKPQSAQPPGSANHI